MEEPYSLATFNQYIRQALLQSVPGLYWIVAEINEIHIGGSGHCFLELTEKATDSEHIIAKARANIWAYRFRMLQPYFKGATGQDMIAGLKVMLQVSVEFHALYGFSLQITDINPAFTVGDLAIQRQSIIRQLTDEGVIDMNKELLLTTVPQRIAVISSETAAGYGDFSNQLHDNPYGYAFRQSLFPAVMQGNEAENSIIGALEQIFDREDEFDVVVLIRGGGSQSDLNCFNSYRLTCSLAQFPLPILTGIGHDRDETIADRVAFVALKTPTAVAEYLINKAFLFDNRLQELTQQLAETMESAVQLPERYLQEQSRRLHNILQSFLHRQDKSIQTYRFRLAHAGAALLLQHRNEQDRRLVSLRSSVRNMLQTQKARLPDLAHKLNLLDPKKLLDRGYSITLSGGKVVRGIKGLKDGQKLETVFQDGRAESVVVGKWRPLF